MIPAVCLGEGYGGVTLMGVVRSLGRMRIPVYALSSRDDSPARFSRYCTYRLVPNARREPEKLERVLVEQARNHPERPVLLVIGDAEALFVASRRAVLEPYYRINLPHSSLIARLIDKRQQYRAVEQLGMPMPRTYYDVTSADVRRTQFEFPVLIKPAVSAQWPHGRLKALVVDGSAQLERQLVELERAGAPVVIQSVIPGPASQLYTVLAYLSRTSEPMAWATYRKVRQYPADFGLAAFAKTVHEPALEDASLRLLKGLAFTGVCGIEFKRDPRDGCFRFIELNPRFELSNSLLARAGANVAFAMYADLTGCAVPLQKPYRDGVAWIALNLEWKACRELAARGEFSWLDWARSLRGLRTEALFAWDDPIPGFATYLRVLKNGLSLGRRGRVSAAAANAQSPRPKDSP